MTPEQAIKKLEKIADALHKITEGLCRITSVHPEEYGHIVRNSDVYYKLLDVRYHVGNLREYIEKNKDKIV